MIGKAVRQYEIIDRLGRGGMGIVYKARDTVLDRMVALKFLTPGLDPDPAARERFLLEARSASALNHPNICTIYEIGTSDDGQMFISMAYYEGQTLSSLLSESDKPPPLDRSLKITAELADALSVAHEKGIIHRDVKPANVLLTDRGRAILLDFGLAKLLGRLALTRTGSTLGTAAYMSPEQARGDAVDEKTDVWSLGVLLWQMCTGRLPFVAEYEQAALYQIINQEPEGIEEIERRHGSQLASLISACLAKSPVERPSAETVLGTLRDLMGVSAKGGRRKRSVRSSAFRRSTVRLGLISVAAFLVAGIGYMIFELTSTPGQAPAPVALLRVSFPVQDSLRAHAAAGMQRILTDELVRLSRERQLRMPVVPMDDLTEYEISDAPESNRVFGVGSVITIDMEDLDGPLKVTVRRRDAEVETTLDSAAFIATNLRFTYLRAIERMTEMLEGSAEAASAISGTYSPDAFETYVEATGYLVNGREQALDRSIALLSDILVEEPTFHEAGSRLAEAYARKTASAENPVWAGRIDSLMLEYDWLNREPDALVARGTAYQSIDSLGPARKSLQRAWDLDSLNVEAGLKLIRILEEEGSFDEAEGLYRRLVAVDPDYWRPHMRLGVFLYNQSRYEEAASEFEEVIRVAPRNDRGYASLGAMHYYLGSLDRAEDVFLGAPEPSAALYSNLATLYFVSGDYRKATKWYENALALDASGWNLWSNLASAYYWLPDEHERYVESVREAMKRVKAALEEDPSNDELQAHMASFHAQLGDTLESLGYLEGFGDTPDQSITAPLAFEIAVTWEGIGFRSKALNWMEAALRLGYSRTEIDTYPGLEDLRRDPRYQALLDTSAAIE